MAENSFKYSLHGTTVPDPYRWLEDVDSAETRSWIDCQNARTSEFLETVPQRPQIRSRVTELWNYPRSGVPVKEGSRYFYLKNDGLQNQSVLFTKDGLSRPERVLLDPNELSVDGTVALFAWQASLDGRLLAYGLPRAGSDWE